MPPASRRRTGSPWRTRRIAAAGPWRRVRVAPALAAPAGWLAGALVGALVGMGAPLRGHDLWLVPSSFQPAPGARISVRILVGHGPGDGQPLAPRPGWIERFVVAGPDGVAAIAAVAGADPAGYAVVGAPGVYAVGLQSGDTLHTLAAERFARFVAEEGLEEAAGGGFGPRTGSEAGPGAVRELFSRSVKSLVRVAEGSGPGGRLGHELELVPLSDPSDRGSPELALRVLLRGEPAAGILVEAASLAGGAPVARAVSDRQGTVRLALPAAAERRSWLATAVALEAAPPGSGADWRSLWSSLTFER